MLDQLSAFSRWGPHGLYATLALLCLSVPAGYAYAYTAHVGYKRTGITRPSAERRKAAIGGAILIAVAIVFLRHILGADLRQVMNGAMDGTLAAMMVPVDAISGFLASEVQDAPNVFVRLSWAIASIFVIPVSAGVALGAAVGIGALAGFGFLGVMAAGSATVGGALLAAVIALPGFLLGIPVLLYLYFVRLPLQVAFLRARRGGRWPTAAELSEAIMSGTMEKSAWQSEIMEYKARKFEGRLERETSTLRKKMG